MIDGGQRRDCLGKEVIMRLNEELDQRGGVHHNIFVAG